MKHFGYFTHSDCAIHDMGHMHPESPMRLRAIDIHLKKKGYRLTSPGSMPSQPTPNSLNEHTRVNTFKKLRKLGLMQLPGI